MRSLEAGASNVDSVKALLESRDKVVDSIGVAEGRYRAAGNALTTYATVLDRVQSDTLHALRAAHNAAGDGADAADDQSKFHRRAQDAKDAGDTEEQSKWEKKEDAAERAGSQAAGAVAAQKRVVERAVDDRDAAARTAIEAINSTTSNDGLNDSWWDDWGAKLTEWVAKVAEAVAAIAGILALALCWIPVIGPALAALLLTVAAIAAIVAAIANIILAATGEKAWGEAVVGVVLGVLACVGCLVQRVWVGLVGLRRQGEAWLGFGMHTLSELLKGRLPQTAEIAAFLVLAAGLSVGTTANVFTGTDQHIFAQGKPVVGEPQVITRAPIAGLQDLTAGMPMSYNSAGVRVTALHVPGQPTRYIVEAPGTQAEMFGNGGWNGNPNARDWPANLWAVSTGDSAYEEGVKQAIAKAIAQDQATYGNSGGRPEILLSGHSQGGIVMANLTSDSDFTSKYNIRGVITAGSPVECAEIPSDIKVMSIQHGAPEVSSTIAGIAAGAVPGVGTVVQVATFLTSGDIVPATDDGGRTILGTYEGHPNITRVVTPPPGNDPLTNHAQDNYALDHLDRPDVRRFEADNGLSDFYYPKTDSAGPKPSSTTYDVPIGATFG